MKENELSNFDKHFDLHAKFLHYQQQNFKFYLSKGNLIAFLAASFTKHKTQAWLSFLLFLIFKPRYLVFNLIFDFRNWSFWKIDNRKKWEIYFVLFALRNWYNEFWPGWIDEMMSSVKNVFILILLTSCLVWQTVNSVLLAPELFNLVSNRKVAASATCGEGIDEPELYCKLTGSTASERESSSYLNLIQVSRILEHYIT